MGTPKIRTVLTFFIGAIGYLPHLYSAIRGVFASGRCVCESQRYYACRHIGQHGLSLVVVNQG